MPTLTITKSYADGDILTEADLDNIRNDVITFLNTTKLDDDNIQDAGITGSSKLIDSSVTTAKINDAAITTAKIADLAVTSDKLAANIGSFVGEIKSMHTFNGTISIPRGWMILNGDIVNSTNYDAIHGAGAYTADGVSGSAIDGKNLPNLVDKYEVGASATTQDGTSAITAVGNTDHEIDIQHSHVVSAHNHQMYDYNDSAGSTASDKVYDNAGNSDFPSTSSTGLNFATVYHDPDVSGLSGIAEDIYTANYGPEDTSNGLSTTQSIQPESIEVIKIMKVI